MDDTLKGTGIRLPKTHIEQLDQLAVAKRVSRNVVILWALDEYLARFFTPDCLPRKTIDNPDDQPADLAAA